ncbi:MAG: hypothetical protein R3C18_07260 [Planctomycetaceae bacterium]
MAHGRSRRALIAFSNRHFYDGELVTFPRLRCTGDGVRLEYVPDGRWVDRKNQKEARSESSKMIVEHVRTKPNKSLGIIALNQNQQRAIEDGCKIFLNANNQKLMPCLMATTISVRLMKDYSKNLENVQGRRT